MFRSYQDLTKYFTIYFIYLIHFLNQINVRTKFDIYVFIIPISMTFIARYTTEHYK